MPHVIWLILREKREFVVNYRLNEIIQAFVKIRAHFMSSFFVEYKP